MAHSFARVTVHVVFATKGRRNSIPERKLQQLWAYVIGIGRNKKIPIVAVGGMPNHIHILLGLPTTMTLSDAISAIKANSSRFMGRSFQWQQGYGAFAVSVSQVNTVERYIRNQAQHHKKRTFEEEFLVFLQKASIPHDPETVFD